MRRMQHKPRYILKLIGLSFLEILVVLKLVIVMMRIAKVRMRQSLLMLVLIIHLQRLQTKISQKLLRSTQRYLLMLASLGVRQ